MRIVFMGTPDYAAVTLQKLIDERYEIAAVFAQPDKPVGRKQVLTPPETKVLAEKYNIPLLGQIPIVQSIREGGDSGEPAALSNRPDGLAFIALAENIAGRLK